jgi:hypothetical protein
MRRSFWAMGFATVLLGVSGAEAGVRCTRDYAPVCARGPEGVRTYDNRNCARAAHARILRHGRCRKDIEPVLPNPYGPTACPMIHEPVCGERGGVRLTFPNSCFAATAGAVVVSHGVCWW